MLNFYTFYKVQNLVIYHYEIRITKLFKLIAPIAEYSTNVLLSPLEYCIHFANCPDIC